MRMREKSNSTCPLNTCNYERDSVNALGNTTTHVTVSTCDHCLHKQEHGFISLGNVCCENPNAFYTPQTTR